MYICKKATEEHRKNLSESHKGQKAWNKGISPSPESIEKGRQKQLGRKASPESIEKNRISHLNKTLSEETKKKIGDANRGRKGQIPWNKGITILEEQKEQQRQAMLGKIETEEHKQKISQALKGRKQTPEHIENTRKAREANKLKKQQNLNNPPPQE